MKESETTMTADETGYPDARDPFDDVTYPMCCELLLLELGEDEGPRMLLRIDHRLLDLCGYDDGAIDVPENFEEIRLRLARNALRSLQTGWHWFQLDADFNPAPVAPA